MPYNYKISKNLYRILEKLFKKDKNLYEQVLRKIEEIIGAYDIEHYKNLRQGMKNFKRVHIEHFDLIFQFDKTNNLILFDDCDHHDKIYFRK